MNSKMALTYIFLAALIWTACMAALLLLPRALAAWRCMRQRTPPQQSGALDAVETVAGYRDLVLKSAAGVAAVMTFLYAIDSAKEQLAQNREQAAIEVFRDAIDRLVKDGQDGRAGDVARAGGIYMLGELVKQNAQLQRPVMQTLSGLVRQTSSRDDVKLVASAEPVSADIQAALDVIGRRDADKDDPIRLIDLTNTYLYRANLSNLGFAHMLLSRADLRRADIRNAVFDGADLRAVRLNDWEANGWNAVLAERYWTLPQDEEYKRYAVIADLRGASFRYANLSGAELSGADMRGVDLSCADLYETNLSRVNLRGARGLTNEQLRSACADSLTRVDPGLEPPRSCQRPKEPASYERRGVTCDSERSFRLLDSVFGAAVPRH